MDNRFLAFATVSLLLIMTPGPDMALITRNALASGKHAASVTALGVAVGIFGWAIAVAAGIGVLLDRSVIAFTVLKLVGAVYLAFLGIRSLVGSFRSGRSTSHLVASAESRPLGTLAAFRQGLLGNMLNPKAGIIFVSVLPQFLRPGDPPIRLVLMLLTFEAMLLAWLNLYGYLVNRAGRSRAGVSIRKNLDRATGVVLIGLGLRLALERR